MRLRMPLDQMVKLIGEAALRVSDRVRDKWQQEEDEEDEEDEDAPGSSASGGGESEFN